MADREGEREEAGAPIPRRVGRDLSRGASPGLRVVVLVRPGCERGSAGWRPSFPGQSGRRKEQRRVQALPGTPAWAGSGRR